MKHHLAIGIAAATTIVVPAMSQRAYPQANRNDLPAVRAFLARFDPGEHYFPGVVATKNGVQVIRQPSPQYCTRNSAIDALAPFRRSPDLTDADKSAISMALESSKVCQPSFARLPGGGRLTSLRTVLGKGIRIVDYRLGSNAEREACTRTIHRPNPIFERQWTMSRAYSETVYVAYDVGFDGRVVNIRDFGPTKGYSRNVRSATSSDAINAVARTSFANPMLNGEQLYCINVIEKMTKFIDGEGLVTGSRSHTVMFEDPGF